MSRGWIKLHRQIDDNEFWLSEKFTKGQAWVDLLILANHKPSTIFIRGIEINLKAGELCYSQLTLAKRWKWNFKTVVTFLKMLEKRKMLETKTNNVTTIISINNWSLFQGNGEQNGEQIGEEKENKTETDKNDKNDKKEIEDQRFETLWNEYPRKIAKKKAKQVFLRKCKDDNTYREIMEALMKHKQSAQWNKENGQFIPHPATWLYQERWKDEIEETEQTLIWE